MPKAARTARAARPVRRGLMLRSRMRGGRERSSIMARRSPRRQGTSDPIFSLRGPPGFFADVHVAAQLVSRCFRSVVDHLLHRLPAMLAALGDLFQVMRLAVVQR